MKKPILYTETPIFSQGDYDVFVGALEEDRLPMYVVINRGTGVVEFTHETTAFYKDWLSHFAKPDQEAEKISQLSLNLARAN